MGCGSAIRSGSSGADEPFSRDAVVRPHGYQSSGSDRTFVRRSGGHGGLRGRTRVHASVNMDGWFFSAIHERGQNQPLLVIEQLAARAELQIQTQKWRQLLTRRILPI